ncbi:MAG: hypothetical protein LKM39_00110 [Chiayiivirga sp.]|nr:hypothetical protein [Chiayiivirga sp.]
MSKLLRIAARLSRSGRSRRTRHADIVLFPELALSGYPPEDLLYRPVVPARMPGARWMRIAAAVHGIVAVVGWPQAAGAVVYNAASVLRDGAIEQTLPQARTAQLRGVRRAPLLRCRSGSRRLRVRGRRAPRSAW